MPNAGALPVFTPDDIMNGALPKGRIVVFDDDHYYMGGVMAEVAAKAGCAVTLVTPAAFVSDWTRNTLEQGAIHRRLAEAGVKIVLNTGVTAIRAEGVETNCAYTDARDVIEADAVILVASRRSEDALYHGLLSRQAEWADAGIRTVQLIGDAAAPGPIAWATYAGHRYARELDTGVWPEENDGDWGDKLSFRREITELAAD